MAATVDIYEYNGAGETGTSKTSGTVRFKVADNATVDLNNPIVVPTSGQHFSMRKVLRMRISSGSFTQISNPRAYSDGANGFGTGITCWMALTGTYTQPAIPTESNATPQFPGSTPMTDWFAKTSGSPADMDAINAGPFDSTGLPKAVGDYLNLVLEVETTAVQGVLSAETLSLAWDEV